MNIRPAISAPLPWLLVLAGKVYGKRKPAPGKRRPLLKLPRSLSFTREGKWFLGVLLLIGISAINTANNLLYLIVTTLLSLIIVSGLISESTLRKVSASRTFPREIYRGSPAIVRVAVSNRKRFLPSFSFKVEAQSAEGLKADPVYILKVAPGDEVVRTSMYTFGVRGKFTLPGVRVSTRFPFGLFVKGKDERDPLEVIVFPSLKVTKKTTVILRSGPSGDLFTSVKGDGTDIYGLRDINEGDDARLIHWKSAAKASKLLVKEFEEEKVKKVFVVFKNFSTGDSEAFEEAVDEASAVSNAFIERGYSVGLKTLSVEIPPGRGRTQLTRILEALAFITPADKLGSPRVRVENA
ncbi:MAG: DUF58 domain-containing protein [Deltaproteobacteria bacterium]|nr:DUF58 domain-containing protein [Deltaproteobacteria bacterium]